MEKTINAVAQSQFLSKEMLSEPLPLPVIHYQFMIQTTGEYISPDELECEADEFAAGDILSSKEGKQKFVVMDIDSRNALITLDHAKNAYFKIAFLLSLLIACWFPISYIFEHIFR